MKDDDIPIMSTERPLDALLPDLAESRTPLSISPMHQRVLEVELEEGFEWVLACWRDPGGLSELNAHLRNLVEAALLAHLSQPGRYGEVLARRYMSMRFFCFDELPDGLADAVRPFGFEATSFDPLTTVARMSALQDEASRLGWQLAKTPKSVWQAPIVHPSDDNAPLLDAAHAQLAEALGEQVWGERPGHPSRLMAEALEAQFKVEITPDLNGLRTLELLLVQHDEGPVRWMAPLFFQGLCDFVGVLLHTLWSLPAQWCLCEQDPLGLYPPPHFRFPNPGGDHEHLLIGLQLLRWCVMPIQPGESIPPLTEWLEGTFAPR